MDFNADRYSERRAEACVRAFLRDHPGATFNAITEAVGTYRGPEYLEHVARGLCAPTRFDVGWILNCMEILGSVERSSDNRYTLALSCS